MRVATQKKENHNYIKIYFKGIEECDGNYEISNKGHIRSSKVSFKKIIKPQEINGGRFRVHLYDNNNKIHSFYVDNLLNKYFPDERKPNTIEKN
jgi:hypothetical protein